MSSSFGKIFRITTFGESHGPAVGVVIDGIPAGLKIDFADVQQTLDRRRPGQSSVTSPRQEPDLVKCLSGVEDGITLGSPLTLIVENKNQKPDDYDDLQDVLRPSHADYTTLAKYGIKAKSGGGRSSARETIGRVAAGAVAEQLLKKVLPAYEIVAWVHTVSDIRCEKVDEGTVRRHDVEKNLVRCPELDIAAKMQEAIKLAQAEGDSLGGIVRCVIRDVLPGLGSPVFDKLEADLAKAMMSLPATKGFEIGSGFAGTLLKGSEHNDLFEQRNGKVGTRTNNSGGVQGGISNGEMIVFNVAFKPVATIKKPQQTLNHKGEVVVASPKNGRHDSCVLPRAVPMVEAMANIVIADHWLRNQTSRIDVDSL